jgi:hypothetical protein
VVKDPYAISQTSLKVGSQTCEPGPCAWWAGISFALKGILMIAEGLRLAALGINPVRYFLNLPIGVDQFMFLLFCGHD